MSQQTNLLNAIELWIKAKGIEIGDFIQMLEHKHPTVQLVVHEKAAALVEPAPANVESAPVETPPTVEPEAPKLVEIPTPVQVIPNTAAAPEEQTEAEPEPKSE